MPPLLLDTVLLIKVLLLLDSPNQTAPTLESIMLFPSLDMVVVFTGGNYVDEVPVDEIIERYILPAVVVQRKFYN